MAADILKSKLKSLGGSIRRAVFAPNGRLDLEFQGLPGIGTNRKPP
jgi:hypothetical protein